MFTFRKLTLAAAFGVAALTASALLAPRAQAQITVPNTIVYDSFTGGAYASTGGVPHNAIGTSLNLATPLPGGTISPVQLVGADVYVASNVAATYTAVRFNLNIFGAATNALSGTANVFSNQLASYTYTTGTFTAAAATFYTFSDLAFPTNVTLPSNTNIGFSLVITADFGNGAGFVATDNFSSLLTTYASQQPAVGTTSLLSAGSDAFYRNASGTAGGNFIGTDARVIAPGYTMSLRLHALAVAVPEPGSIALVALGGLPLMGVVLRRRRK